MPVGYGQSQMRTGAAELDLSDSEDDDEMMMMDGDHGNFNGNGNGHGDSNGEEDDLSHWTLDTFKSRPIGGDTAVNTVSWHVMLIWGSES